MTRHQRQIIRFLDYSSERDVATIAAFAGRTGRAVRSTLRILERDGLVVRNGDSWRLSYAGRQEQGWLQ